MERWIDHQELGRMTGMIVPAYFSAKPSDSLVRHLAWMTLGDCPHYLPLENVWVVTDGDARTARIVAEVREQFARDCGATFHLLALPENGGKLWAIRAGMRALLAAKAELAYIVIRDGDGDHAVADMPPLVRAAASLAEAYGHRRIILVGARRSRHRPMGWLRGELEGLLDQVTLDALAYRLAREGRALNLGHRLGRESVPDLSSGYKVYGREVAHELFVAAEPRLTCLAANDYWHYGPETVAVVEGILAGAVFAEAPRTTWDGQPTSSFGEFKQVTLYGELLAWVLARLEAPLEAAAQWIDNYTPGMSLRTTVEGRETLATVRRYALEKVQAYRGEAGALPPPAPVVPFL